MNSTCPPFPDKTRLITIHHGKMVRQSVHRGWQTTRRFPWGEATRGIGKDHRPRSPRSCPSASRAFALVISYYTIAACLLGARARRAHPRLPVTDRPFLSHLSPPIYRSEKRNRGNSRDKRAIVYYSLARPVIVILSFNLKEGKICLSFSPFPLRREWRMF